MMPPPLPVIVIVEVPVRAVLETVILKSVVPEPGAGIGLGLKLPVTPEGKPVADMVIAELNPPETAVVTTTYPLWPWAIEPDVGDTEIVNAAGAGAVTVRETVVVSVNPPPVPVMVMGYVPVTAFDATVKVTVDVPEPGAAMGVGLKPTVTPVGWPDALRETAELNVL